MLFHYTAVSASGKKKVSGEIEGQDEKEARRKLNKMGFSILTIGLEILAPNTQGPVRNFEFEAKDKTGQRISGTVDALSREAAYDRLTHEFNFEVQSVYAVNLSPAEKKLALEEGVRTILSAKDQKAELEADAKRRTIKGGLESLVKIKKKESSPEEEELLRKRLAGVEKVKAERQARLSTEVASNNFDIYERGEEVQKSALQEALEEKLGKRKGRRESQILNWLKAKLEKAGNVFNKTYYHLTEIIIPPKLRTRQQAWKDLFGTIFKRKVKPVEVNKFERLIKVPEDIKIKLKQNLDRRLFLEHFWKLFENITAILAALFFVYFVAGNLLAGYELNTLSDFLRNTLSSPLIPFLTFALLLLRLVMWIREKLTSWSLWRTTVLFLSSFVLLVILGVNLL
jgi:hypothetical protein